MAQQHSWTLWSGFWATSLGTLASRVLGLARDMATASLLGLGGGVMDAFVVAFRIPNLLRRIFGEGALAASFLPVFTDLHQREPRTAWQLFSVLLVWLGVVLSAVVLLGEAACGLWWWLADADTANGQLVALLAAMLPYMVLICLAAQASAALQAMFEFRVPAMAPAILNICWLVAALVVAPRLADDQMSQALIIAAAVLVSGVLQIGVQVPALYRHGFRFNYDWSASRQAFWLVIRTMLPVALGLAVTQFNTLADSLIAWALSAEPGVPRTMSWGGADIAYPLQSGAAAAIYYGERFYQLPVGLLGVATATVIYPLLSRHAARGDSAAVGADLTTGLRLVVFMALPASVGLMLVADPLVRALLQHGEFTSDDAARAARMIACYAGGVWAYCAIPVLVRGYYAAGNRTAPAKLGIVAVGVNLALNIVLIWPLAERGLAVATAVAASTQAALLAFALPLGAGRLAWRDLLTTFCKSGIATVLMAAVVIGVDRAFAASADASRMHSAGQAVLMIAAGVVVYLATARLLGMRELSLLFTRPQAE